MRIEGGNNSYKKSNERLEYINREERINKLKNQVANGTFQPNIQEVAKKLLNTPDARRDLGIDIKV